MIPTITLTSSWQKFRTADIISFTKVKLMFLLTKRQNLTLAELSLVDEPSEVEPTLVTAMQIMEGVVAEVVVGGRGGALNAPNT